jgi:hypothetical protein
MPAAEYHLRSGRRRRIVQLPSNGRPMVLGKNVVQIEVQLGNDADVLPTGFVTGMMASTPNCMDWPDQMIRIYRADVFSP